MVVESLKKAGSAAGRATANHITEGGSVNLFFFLAIVAHIIDGLFQYNQIVVRTATYFGLGILGWFMAFREPGSSIASRESMASLAKSILLGVVAWGLPIALLRLGPSLGISTDLLNIIVSVWPAYLIWFVFLEPTTPLLHSIQKIITTIWVVIGIMALYSAIEAGQLENIPALRNTERTDIVGAWGNVWQMFRNSIEDILKAIISLPSIIERSIERQIDYATGGEYYASKEEQVEERLGVFLKNIKESNPEIKENESVEIWGTLEVKSKSEDPLFTEIRCNSSNVTGTHSLSHFSVEGNDEIDIDCIFEEGFKKGKHEIDFFATYNFATSAYIKSYFIDEDRRKTMKKAGIDILQEIGITEKEPIARYTSGPIKIGMSTSSQPIGIDQEGTIKPKIGFTIENSWEGQVKEITLLSITLPKGLELDEENCDYPFTQIDMGEYTTTYRINKEVGKIKRYRTFNCRAKVTDMVSLLGSTQLSTKEISVSAEYIFEIKERRSISIK